MFREGVLLDSFSLLYICSKKVMIYLEDINDMQEVIIPIATGAEIGEDAVLHLHSLTADIIIEPTAIVTRGQYAALLFALHGNIIKGEYKYTFLSQNAVISQGIAVIGNYKKPIQEYNDKETKIIQYGD